MNDYWQVQQPDKPLFGNVLWNKPERRDQAGRLTIVGGNSRGFWAVALAYQTAVKVGVGQIRIIMPDALRSKLPSPLVTQLDGLTLTPSNPSGGLASDAEKYLLSAASWANNILFIGDNGANAETTQLLCRTIADPRLSDVNITLARDTVDLVTYDAEAILNRPKTNLVVSIAQLQKLARAVFYPRVITFSQGVKQIAETLHKFSITYPTTITLFHDDNLFVANNGQVISQKFNEPIRVWNGEMPTRAAIWQVWNSNPIEAIATSWTEL